MKRISDDLIQLKLPMRRNPLGYTYSYLLEKAAILVDTGVPDPNAYDALKNQLKQRGLEIQDLQGVIITHLHRDHVGMLDYIKNDTALKVIALDKAVKVQKEWQDRAGNRYEDMKTEATLWGGSGFLSFLSRYEHVFRRTRSVIEINGVIKDGDFLEFEDCRLKAIWTPGHSKEHLCLYDNERQLLYSGDHVLPKITSHISLHTYQDWDPLEDYLNSLDKVSSLSVVAVLPSHESIFYDLEGRIIELKMHHERRCDEIIDAINMKTKTVFQIASKISWDSRPWSDMNFWTKGMAAAETYAHLIYLRNRGKIKEEKKSGVLNYTV